MFRGKWQLIPGWPLALLMGPNHFFGSSMFRGKWQLIPGWPLALLMGPDHFFGSSMFNGKWQLNWWPLTLLISGVCTHCFWA